MGCASPPAVRLQSARGGPSIESSILKRNMKLSSTTRVLFLTGFLAALTATVDAAQQFSAPDAEAFVRAYRLHDGLRVVLDERIKLMEEKGQISPKQISCLEGSVPLERIVSMTEPAIAASFSSRENLGAATAFFQSSAGAKTVAQGIETARAVVRAKMRGLPVPEVRADPSLSRGELISINQFFGSVPGKEFASFVSNRLPELQRVDLFTPAVERCKAG